MSQSDDITGVTLRLDTGREETFERNRPYLIVLSGANVGEMFPLQDGTTTIGRGRGAQIRLVDEGVSRRHALVYTHSDDHSQFWLKDLDSRNGTYCNGHQIREHQLCDGDKIQLGRGIMLRFAYQDKYDESFQQLMHDSALRDGLTQAFNKRYFTERLHGEFQFAKRHKEPLSLILMDLDHFKQINDHHGHAAGDHVLSLFAQAVHKSIRNEDVFARYGGEEFVIISRSVSLEDTQRIAERLRAVVENLNVEYQGHTIPTTMSIGVAAIPHVAAKSPIELIHAADQALYQAKVGGRNQVCIYDPQVDPRGTAPKKSARHAPAHTPADDSTSVSVPSPPPDIPE